MFKPQDCTPSCQDGSLRQPLGFELRPASPHHWRRLDATLPEAEAQVQALGQQILVEWSLVPMSPRPRPLMGACTKS